MMLEPFNHPVESGIEESDAIECIQEHYEENGYDIDNWEFETTEPYGESECDFIVTVTPGFSE